MHERYPRKRYVVVALVDMRSPADAGRLDDFAREIGARVDLVTTASGTVHLPPGVLEKGQELVARHETAATSRPAPLRPPRRPEPSSASNCTGPTTSPTADGTDSPPPTGPGWRPALPAMAERIAEALPAGARRVLGFEELMYAPLRLAHALEQTLGGDVTVRCTSYHHPLSRPRRRRPRLRHTHPPGLPRDDHPADGPGERYAYNVAGAGFDAVVAVVDSVATPRRCTPRTDCRPGSPPTSRTSCSRSSRRTSCVPRTPPKGPPPCCPSPCAAPTSPRTPDEVGWLLQDLSDVTLEAPTEEREEAIQSGGAHYAESLPVEYQPSEQYQQLFHAALETSAARLARAVGAVTEIVLAERSPRPVLVSLARAGTPVGVLMRRWAQFRHGLDLPHYAVSIVRGRGIDANALRWLAGHHDPADVVFVDGFDGARAPSPANWPPPCASSRRPTTSHRLRPGDRRTGRPRLLRAHLRHPRRLPHPLRLPQLHRLRTDIPHRAPRRPGRPARLPRREVLPRTRRRRPVTGLPRRRLAASPTSRTRSTPR
ncbi:hypothetical protein STENM327S_02068 [Streptomyces tendae]